MLPSLKQARVPFNASNTMYSLCSFGTSGERWVCWGKFAAVVSCRAHRPRGRHHSGIYRVRMLEASGPRDREFIECRRWKTFGADTSRASAPPRRRPGSRGRGWRDDVRLSSGAVPNWATAFAGEVLWLWDMMPDTFGMTDEGRDRRCGCLGRDRFGLFGYGGLDSRLI